MEPSESFDSEIVDSEMVPVAASPSLQPELPAQARQLKSINSSNRSIIITQNGKPAAVVLSPSEFDRLNAQSRFISAVQQGLDDVQAGRVIDDDSLDAVLEHKIAK